MAPATGPVTQTRPSPNPPEPKPGPSPMARTETSPREGQTRLASRPAQKHRPLRPGQEAKCPGPCGSIAQKEPAGRARTKQQTRPSPTQPPKPRATGQTGRQAAPATASSPGKNQTLGRKPPGAKAQTSAARPRSQMPRTLWQHSPKGAQPAPKGPTRQEPIGPTPEAAGEPRKEPIGPTQEPIGPTPEAAGEPRKEPIGPTPEAKSPGPDRKPQHESPAPAEG